MAKSLLLSTLSSFLGKYVEGLSQENLKLGVWSGKLEFNNLSLKETALDGLNLPVSVRKGFLKTLNVKVPWSSLGSKPVEVVMDGIYLLATPLDLSVLKEEDIEKIILARKRELLYATDIMINAAISKFEADLSEESSNSSSASYIQQLSKRIIDNLEVSITNIHIRFEDFLSVPKKPIAFGITLNKIILNTTDENGNPTFYKRENNSKSVYKLASLMNLGIYWHNLTPNSSHNPPPDSLITLNQLEFNKKMQELIFANKDNFDYLSTKLNYILSPKNQWKTRIIHNPTCSSITPMIDIIIDGDEMSFSLSKDQFHQLLTFLENLSILDEKKKKKADCLNKMIDVALINELGKKYQKLIFNQKILQYTKYSDLKEDELREIKQIEKDLPLNNLIFYRSNGLNSSLKEIKEYILNNKKKIVLQNSSSSSSKGSWFGGWFSSKGQTSTTPTSSKEAEEDEEAMRKIQKELDDISKEAFDLAQQVFSFRLTLSSKSNFVLTTNNGDVLRSYIFLTCNLENRLQKTEINLQLKDFFITDLTTKKPYYRNIIYLQNLMKNVETKVNPFQLPSSSSTTSTSVSKYEIISKNPASETKVPDDSSSSVPCHISLVIEPENSVLRFVSQPLIIIYNPDCCLAIIDFLQSESGLSATGPAYLYQTAFGFKEELQLNFDPNDPLGAPSKPKEASNKVFNLFFDIQAPKIFIPSGDLPDDLTLVIDTGSLGVNGEIKQTSMNWSLNLKNTSALITNNYNLDNLSIYLNSSPPCIIDPLKLKVICSINRECLDKQLININVSTSSVSIRTSLNTLVHATKIVNRVLLLVPPPVPSPELPSINIPPTSSNINSSSSSLVLKSTSSSASEVKNSPFILSINTDFDAINFILINDYQGRNNPLLKLDVTDIAFGLSGPANHLGGDGKLLITLDYYNQVLRVWEPVMEPWEPKLELLFYDGNVNFSVEFTNNTIQFNITGGMLKCLMNTIDLLTKLNKRLIGDEQQKKICEKNSSLITITNNLDCIVEIMSLSNETREKFLPYETKKLSIKKFKNERFGKFSQFVNMSIYDINGSKVITTLYNLPLTSYKLKVYPCFTNDSNNSSKDILVPVVETVYEYSKYNFLKRRWTGSSGNTGEPPHYSDILMSKDLDINKYVLPEGWVWLESNWRPDLSGKIGEEIDTEGWEYGSSFSAFHHNSHRRVKIASDTVRRRKLVRTRIYKSSSNYSSGLQSSLKISWDTKANDDESIDLFIRTSKIIENNLQIPLEVGLNFNGKEPSNSIVINPKDVSSIPTSNFGELFIRIRPFFPQENGKNNPSIAWSNEIPFPSDSHRKNLNQDLSNYKFKVDRSISLSNNNIISFGSFVQLKDNTSYISFLPETSFINSLPTSVQVVFPSYSDQVIQIESGCSYDNISSFDGTNFTCEIMINNYKVKQSFLLEEKLKKKEFTIELIDLNVSNTLTLNLLLTRKSNNVLEVLLYSRYLFIDFSGVGVILSDNLAKTNSIFYSPSYTLDSNLMNQISSPKLLNDLWKSNRSGLLIFQPIKNKFNLSVKSNSSEKKEININSITYSKSNIEIYDPAKGINYFLTLQKHSYLPLPKLTSLIYILPTFLVVNYSPNSISFSQISSTSVESISTFQPKTVSSWHGGDKSLEQIIRIRNNTSHWSLTKINLNTIGTISLLCPSLQNDGTNLFNIINIDIRFSDSQDPTSSLIVTIWESISLHQGNVLKNNEAGSIPLAVRNNSHFNFDIVQELENFDKLISTSENVSSFSTNNFNLFSAKRSYHPYGWINPQSKPILSVIPYDSSNNNVKLLENKILLNTLRVSKPLKQVVQESNGNTYAITYEIKLNGQGKELVITSELIDNNSTNNALSPIESYVAEEVLTKKVNIQLIFKSIGLSLIADSPSRHEFINVTLHEFYYQCKIFQYESNLVKNQNFITIQDILCDNFTYDRFYPLLISSKDFFIKENQKDSRMITKNNVEIYAPAISFTYNTKSFSSSMNPIIEQLELLILPLEISIDSSSILYYFLDLHQEILDSTSTSLDQTENIKMQSLINSFNNLLIENYSNIFLLSKNIEKIYYESQKLKYYFEAIFIHPIKIILNFHPTTFSRKSELYSLDNSTLNILKNLETITPIENFEIKIASFNTKEVTESWASLINIISSSIIRNLQSNILKITGSFFGSMSLLGKPVDLYRNIDSGVSDFFYEPINGFKESPIYFFSGLGKGTSSLITGIATGVVGSTANIVKSATGGVSSVGKNIVSYSGDEKFVKQQEQHKRKAQNSSGLLAGLQTGAESITSGFTSGIKGLVTNPYEESKKSGALGFFKGVGKGLVGVAVKPVIGITEGISNVATGISNSVIESKIAKHTRPARAFYNVYQNGSINSLLVPFDKFSADAQEFVHQESFQNLTSDSYITSIKFFDCESDVCTEVVTELYGQVPLNKVVFGLILSRKNLFLVNKSFQLLGSFSISSVSSIELVLDNYQWSINIYLYSSKATNNGTSRLIKFSNQSLAIASYEIIYSFRHLFGNGSSMLPTNEAVEALNNLASTSSVSTTENVRLTTSDKSIVYKFGSSNSKKELTNNTPSLSEKQFMLIMSNNLLKNVLINPKENKDKLFQFIDENYYKLIYTWVYNHDFLNISRCCGCLFINTSSNNIVFNEISLTEGRNFNIFNFNFDPSYLCNINSNDPSNNLITCYDEKSKVLRPKGVMILFGYGNRPHLLSLEHVKFRVKTSAFECDLSTRSTTNTFIKSNQGYQASYAEKTLSEKFAKYVIIVK